MNNDTPEQKESDWKTPDSTSGNYGRTIKGFKSGYSRFIIDPTPVSTTDPKVKSEPSDKAICAYVVKHGGTVWAARNILLMNQNKPNK